MAQYYVKFWKCKVNKTHYLSSWILDLFVTQDGTDQELLSVLHPNKYYSTNKSYSTKVKHWFKVLKTSKGSDKDWILKNLIKYPANRGAFELGSSTTPQNVIFLHNSVFRNKDGRMCPMWPLLPVIWPRKSFGVVWFKTIMLKRLN